MKMARFASPERVSIHLLRPQHIIRSHDICLSEQKYIIIWQQDIILYPEEDSFSDLYINKLGSQLIYIRNFYLSLATAFLY